MLDADDDDRLEEDGRKRGREDAYSGKRRNTEDGNAAASSSVVDTALTDNVDDGMEEDDERGAKRQTTSAGLSGPPMFTLRILCPAEKSGVVIGRGGAIAAQLRAETGARIKVEDFVSGVELRVVSVSSEETENEACKAINGLCRVFDRLSEPEEDGGLPVLSDPATGEVFAKFLLPHNMLSNIQQNHPTALDQLRKDFGIKVGISSGDDVPGCANIEDDMVTLTGSKAGVRAGLARVSEMLLSVHEGEPFVFAPKTGRPMAAMKPATTVNQSGRQQLAAIPTSAPLEPGFRLLCPCGRVGNVIGARGQVVKNIRESTGARISVGERVLSSEEQVVTITAPGDNTQLALDALFRVHEVIYAHENTSGSVFRTRLLIHKSQVGCVLGKKGSIIATIRQETGVQIRISGDVPVCGNILGDQVVQINGDMNQIRPALKTVAEQLLSNPPREDAMNAMPMLAPPFAAAVAAMAPINPTPPPGGLQAGPITIQAAANGQVIAQMVVPNAAVGSILGKGGSNVAQVRQFSGARVKIHEPKPGTTDRVVEITGTPEQIQAAQQIIRMFIGDTSAWVIPTSAIISATSASRAGMGYPADAAAYARFYAAATADVAQQHFQGAQPQQAYPPGLSAAYAQYPYHQYPYT